MYEFHEKRSFRFAKKTSSDGPPQEQIRGQQGLYTGTHAPSYSSGGSGDDATGRATTRANTVQICLPILAVPERFPDDTHQGHW